MSSVNSKPSQAPERTSDPLQVAAQVYPWLYMTSTLDACFESAEKAAEEDISARTRELNEEEADISEQRVRLEAERSIEFYDELASDTFATTAPPTIQAFLAHGDACSALEAEALQLATRPDANHASVEDDLNPMQPYNALLDRLEKLQHETSELHASLVALTQEDDTDTDTDTQQEPSARSQITRLFSACLPLLHARRANLQMARELLEGAKEGVAMRVHLESLGYADGDEEEQGEDDEK